jgi:hypothetical protein
LTLFKQLRVLNGTGSARGECFGKTGVFGLKNPGSVLSTEYKPMTLPEATNGTPIQLRT